MTDEDAERWRAEGFWTGRSLRSILTESAQRFPNRTALVDYRQDGTSRRVTYAEFDRNAHHVASVLDSLGLGAGDSIVLMLPNSADYAEFVFGINEIGGIYTGIPVAYGPHQVMSILRRSKARAFVIPRRYRSTQHLQMIRRLRSDLPHLEHVFVVDEDGTGLLEGEHLWSAFRDVPGRILPDPEPGSVCYLGFTSGTTGEPKGAMHSHETLYYAITALAEHIGMDTFGDPLVQLVASPVGHHTGFHWGILFTALQGGTAVHVDRWEPGRGADIIRREGITCFFGAPTFLQDLLQTDLAGDPNGPLKCLVIAGAPIPRHLPSLASERLGAFISPAWGLTECGIMTAAVPTEPAGILATDGSAFRGSAVKVVDSTGKEVPAGENGDLLMRGPGVALGYFDRDDATREAFLPGLWFNTGDLASIDENGWLALHGRSKDLIIRGGENIPATEIESMIFTHPDVLNVAVIGIPDDRLGERICAVLVTREGVEFTVESLSEYLLANGMSKHYLPERVLRRDDLPMTPSGKIQKFKLRDAVVTGLSEDGARG